MCGLTILCSAQSGCRAGRGAAAQRANAYTRGRALRIHADTFAVSLKPLRHLFRADTAHCAVHRGAHRPRLRLPIMHQLLPEA